MGLKTSATLPAWKGECPQYTPILEQGSHFGGPAPPAEWRRWSKTSFGQKLCFADGTEILESEEATYLGCEFNLDTNVDKKVDNFDEGDNANDGVKEPAQ